MGSLLRVRCVRLDGAAIPHLWEFPDGVTVIVGGIGGGKTSLLNLIEYGLGGSPPITKEITDAASSVTLDVVAGDHHLQLTRTFGENAVLVGEGETPKSRHALKRPAKDPLLSERLLQALGIPVVRVRQARKDKKSTKLTSISFQDVFAYCYLDQEQVDRSTVFDSDPFRDVKRASTFELLHRIIDARVADLEVERMRLKEERTTRTTRVDAVEAFAREKGLPVESEAIGARLQQITAEEARLADELSGARREAEQSVALASEQQEAAARVEQQLALARDELGRTAAELGGVQRAANQLERDLVAMREGEAARSTLEPLPYVVCPRCEQLLGNREHSPSQCVVCLQSDPPLDEDGEAAMEKVAAQLEETRALEAHLVAARDTAVIEVAQLSENLQSHRREIGRLVAAAAAPHLARATQLQEGLGALRGERTALTEARPVTEAVDREREELSAIAPALAELEALEAERREALSPARERVEELSKEFDVILRRFTLPWLETAEVDRDTYLPRVNGRSLRELSSGGMKATTNVAYYLAILVIAQRDRDVLTPSFLMLDSIRKDYGAGAKDLARAERIYTYLRGLQDARRQPGALAADFQLIVVDNDLPSEFEKAFNTILIDPDRPLIRFP
jgi:AAA domain